MSGQPRSVQYMNFDQLSLADFAVYSSIPPHPFWDEVDKVVDFSFADELCAPLYSPNGRRPYPPSLKLKVHLVQRYYNISDREME
ncbi:MAG: transposase, partial [Alicyclobacillus macrosporangiidus]|uniref:transposase n=1 Tax=Alicyclobacillus macrosporangiidus TaxID=392015 RepID=UPI0026EB8E0B